jgi:hypothetical protein
MSFGAGSVLVIDEKGTPYEEVCNLGCPHTVTPVVRRNITIVEEKKVRDFYLEGWANTGPRPAINPAYRAVDSVGREWFRDWDGWYGDAPGVWKTADGRKAESSSPTFDPARQYAARPSAIFAFTDLSVPKEA